MNLSAIRQDIAAIITTALPDEYGVIDHLPDSISPPVTLVAWSDPWLTKATMCAWEVSLEVLCVAQRLEPGGKLETLETMVSSVVPALKGTGFTVRDVTAPFPLNIGGVDYLATTVNIVYDVD